MTCREKLILDHLDWPISELNRAIIKDCPKHHGYLPDPLDEFGNYSCISYECDDCWAREIPGTVSIDDVRRVLNDLL